ncbi:nucleoside recognition domain-containing protein [uncultured Porphyromonas sp.]|uniref:nucleoside recognition domain-containing protein n=1 Tax=uncultured Porphyromonas sp. TaxID=159274 RepID=UPI00262D1888|nr:nucleoside recognition domain-containing protein [uncultured Porphyromonas sp.]
MLLNYIWVAFFLIGILVGVMRVFASGDATLFSEMGEALLGTATTAFEISLGLAGILTLWQGLLTVAEKSGLVARFAKRSAPFFGVLFPSLPKGAPVLGTMLMNFSANLLGLDNAATPLGLQTMKELQALNPNKERASDAMIMFLAINASGLTLIPITIIMFRYQLGSASPADIFLPILLATGASTLTAILLVAWKQRINLAKWPFLLPLGLFIALVVGLSILAKGADKEQLTSYSSAISNVVLLGAVALFIGCGLWAKRNVYEDFIEGAKGGFQTAVTIIPYIVAILVAVALFRASGAMEWLTMGVSWLVGSVGLDTAWVDALPTILMKPLSGSGARGLMIDTMSTYGTDSFVGRLACIVQGTTDTTFYVLALYYGSVAITKTRYTLGVSLFADAVGAVTAVFLAYAFYG